MKKKWYLSKTLWVNFLAIMAIAFFGVEQVPPDIQVAALAAVNFLLRLITGKPVSIK